MRPILPVLLPILILIQTGLILGAGSASAESENTTQTEAIAATTANSVVRPPACKSEAYRAFDFWQGSWLVRNSAGTVVGQNTILPVLGGCALSENWRSAAGNEGKSYNFYDARRNQWHQTWVDDSGGSLNLDGGVVDNKMVMTGTSIGANGPVTNRISWSQLSDGRVKQHWQVSRDAGKTWRDAFLGFYERAPGARPESMIDRR